MCKLSKSVNLLYTEISPLAEVCRVRRPAWARERCRISPPRFLVECRKKLLCFVLFAFPGLSSVFVVSVLDLSSVLYFQVCTDVNDIVYSLIVSMCR